MTQIGVRIGFTSVLKRQRADKLGELQHLSDSFKKIINELGSMMTTIPDQSDHIYQELKDFNLDVNSANAR